MNQSATHPISNRFLFLALGGFLIFWIGLGVHPLDRSDWFLENLLVFVAAIVLGSTCRRFQFSNTSYALILIFLAVHTVGAHYTYAKVPAGFWIQDWFHLQRNHYDRLIHFSFGLLLLYPMRDLLGHGAGAHKRWAPWLSVAALAALSSFFEIVEAVVAQIVHPDLGIAYLGTQGDIWDAQKDMGAALIGAIVAALWLSLRRTRI
jgi:putative membrane protein